MFSLKSEAESSFSQFENATVVCDADSSISKGVINCHEMGLSERPARWGNSSKAYTQSTKIYF